MAGAPNLSYGHIDVPRIIDFDPILKRKSLLLLGPRQTGKSTLLRSRLKDAYTIDLLKSSTFQELIKNPNAFSEIVAALCQCEQVNFTQIGSDAQVPPRTIIDYFSVLEDTLVGALLPAFTKTIKRKAMTTAKFYFFDVGVGNVLANRPNPKLGSAEFGKAFEHYIYSAARLH